MADTANRPLKPHRWWWHPHKSMLDIVLGYLLSLVFGLPKFRRSDEKDLPQAQLDYAQSLRDKMVLIYTNHTAFKKWSARIQLDICMANVTIARNDKIFQEWNICTEHFDVPGNSDIPIQVAFPVSLLPDHVAVPSSKNGYGCLEIKDSAVLDWLPKQIPVVVFFHGGAMTIGCHIMTEAIDLLNAAQTEQPFIYMSVDYSQAPDAPFPAGPCDACSVAEYLLERFENVHICGVSAGGYLALISGLEACRANKHQNLESILSLIPMTDPSTSSDSYVENSTSSHLVPNYLLHWSYQAYLGMPDDADAENNREAWDQNKWKSSALRRLAEPLYDAPETIQNPPNIIIQTNRADPLYDDGVRMIEKLRKNNNSVEHFDVRGSHWVGLLLDKAAYNKLAQRWRETIFSDQ